MDHGVVRRKCQGLREISLRRFDIFLRELVDRQVLECRAEVRINTNGMLELAVRGHQIAFPGQGDSQEVEGLKVLWFSLQKRGKQTDSLIPLSLPHQGLGLIVGLRSSGSRNRYGHEQGGEKGKRGRSPEKGTHHPIGILVRQIRPAILIVLVCASAWASEACAIKMPSLRLPGGLDKCRRNLWLELDSRTDLNRARVVGAHGLSKGWVG